MNSTNKKLTPEEKRLIKNEREKLRLREKRGGLKRDKITEEERHQKKIDQNRKKREYNKKRQRIIRAEEENLSFQISNLIK